MRNLISVMVFSIIICTAGFFMYNMMWLTGIEENYQPEPQPVKDAGNVKPQEKDQGRRGPEASSETPDSEVAANSQNKQKTKGLSGNKSKYIDVELSREAVRSSRQSRTVPAERRRTSRVSRPGNAEFPVSEDRLPEQKRKHLPASPFILNQPAHPASDAGQHPTSTRAY